MSKKLPKYCVLGPGARKTFRKSSRKPRIPFKVLSKNIVFCLDQDLKNLSFKVNI